MQHRFHLALTLTFVIAVATTVNAGEYRPLQGSFMVGGATLIDPPADEPSNTHYYLFLTGDSAKSLYEAMNVTAIHDECRDDGSLIKVIDNMQCLVSVDQADYQCTFGIDLDKQTIKSGSGC